MLRTCLGWLFCLLLSLASAGQVVTSRTNRKIMVFGGRNHDVYLGCLNCSEIARDSVLNPIGNYGSTINSKSILNAFSSYGNKFSSTSACSEFATSLPVIVDDRGGYYGELTMNEIRPRRVRNGSVLRWLASICESH